MRIKIMNCSWNKSLENKQLDVQKVTSKGPKPPTLRQLISDLAMKVNKIDQRIDKIDQRIDNLEEIVIQDHKLLLNVIKLNNLKTS